MKKVLKFIGTVVGVIVLVVAGYVFYVILDYHRIEDNQQLDIKNGVESADASGNAANPVKTGETYSILTHNIGFGAYVQDYSFFMDGGKYSWAYSKESAREAVTSSMNLAKSYDPDFMFVEEVDLDATRTYHLNELDIYTEGLPAYNYDFAVNYDSAFLMYPLTQPHGKSKAGIAVFSKYAIDSAVRRSLPISTGFSKFMDLDRCYSVSKVPVENGKYLCLYAVHTSAYGNDASIRQQQIQMLCDDMQTEYEAGNYVVCGGDFNHDLLADGDSNTQAASWAFPFPRNLLPDGFTFGLDLLSQEEKATLQNSARDANEAYQEGHTETFMLDGFIISDNIDMNAYTVIGTKYSYSDHDPVYMEFTLK